MRACWCLVRTAALCGCAGLLAGVAGAGESVVSNVVAAQRTDGSHIVDIVYDITGATGATSVSVRMSADDGATWPIVPVPESLSGDVGWVTTDGAKAIVYDMNVDLPRTPTSFARAKVISIDTMVTVTLPGGVPMELIYIPPGTFTMGSPADELSSRSDETQFQVQLTSCSYMGRTEVTQQQWLAVMGSWPGSPPSSTNGLGPNYPAYYLSWQDAQNFMSALNAHITTTGQGPLTVRLPTEAEWEYACRAGTTTRFSFGNGLAADENCARGGDRANNMWFCGNNTPSGSKEVAQKPANPFGLYDMHGNIIEWCQDGYGTYPSSPPTQVNPTGPLTSGYRVLRGGNWANYASTCRSAQRGQNVSSLRVNGNGFRVLAVR